MTLDKLGPVAQGPDHEPATGVSRRAFLKAGVASGGFVLGFGLPAFLNGGTRAAPARFEPNAFIRIGSDGSVTLTMPQVEMGQGTYTSMPMLIAEELEIPLSQVRLEHAPPDTKRYGNPLIAGDQITGGSTSIRAFWEPMRRAGATARVMLIGAAAKRWKVDPSACHAERGEVIHKGSGRRIKYGALAGDAAQMPVPEKVELKRLDEFKLIGTPAKRLDTPAKVNGKVVYGIDARPAGLKIATLAQSPVFGGRLKSVDDSAARAVKGVRQIVRLDDAVAVVADHMGAARGGSYEGLRDLPRSVSRPRDDGADELHHSRSKGRLRNLGRNPGHRTGPGHGRKDDRAAAGQSGRPQSSAWRRLRPPPGDRRSHACGANRDASRWAREGHLVPRGRHPA